jgi:hypothetical protein
MKFHENTYKILRYFGAGVILCIFILTALWVIDCIFQNKPDDKDIFYGDIVGMTTAIITLFLVVCAWIQLNDLNKKAMGNDLIAFDKKWGSKEIMMAREIIHEMYIDAQNQHGKENIEAQRLEIGEKIKKYSEDKIHTKKFIYLLNFLNFLETTGYLSNKGYIQKRDIDELMGNSIKFYYEVFYPYIQHRRTKHHERNFHNEFEKLYLAIRLRDIKR